MARAWKVSGFWRMSGHVRIRGIVPPVVVVVPNLLDLGDLPQLTGADHVAHLDLVRIAHPLGAHLHHLFGIENRVARQFRLFNVDGHGFLAIAVFTRPDRFGEEFRVLVVACGDHHSVEIRHSEHVFGVFELLHLRAESSPTISGRLLPVQLPEIAHRDDAEVLCLLGHPDHVSVAGAPVTAAKKTKVDAVVCADHPAGGPGT